MGENNQETSSSWRKMVITKMNNQYVSELKADVLNGMVTDTKNFSLSEEEAEISYQNVKVEAPEARDASVSSSYSSTYEEAMNSSCDVDPLMASTPKRGKRKGNSTLQNESPDERAMRLAKMSAYAAQRLAKETPEQRSARLRRMSEYAAKRLAEETEEQRARRLARMSAYAARRLASESPEQRQLRLSRMSAYAARRQALKKYVQAHEEKD